MNDAISLLHESLPFVIMALLFAGAWRASNMTVTLSWAARTHEPERDQKMARLKVERDEARRVAEEMREGRT